MIPVNVPLITEADIESVVDVLRQGWISGEAPIVAEFEHAFAVAHGQTFGVCVPNGSLALDLVFSALEIGPGDEIIMPSFTIISCLSEILRRGATPVFVDSELSTWNMDVSKLEEAITPQTVAILTVHTYGLPVDMKPVMSLAEKHCIPIIEDAAEAHGLRYEDLPCGSMGFASTFSFYANKNVTTGEGGIILTSDEVFAERLRYLRNLTFSQDQRFVHDEIGWNLRFTAIQAALGMSQLSRLESTIRERRKIASQYRDKLSEIEGVRMAPDHVRYATNDYWVVGVLLSSERFPRAAEVAAELASKGVQTRPFFFPLHKQPVYFKSPVFREYSNPCSEILGNYGLYLPNGLGSTQDQIDQAVEISYGVLAS